MITVPEVYRQFAALYRTMQYAHLGPTGSSPVHHLPLGFNCLVQFVPKSMFSSGL
jgi:hypothetical protein